MKELLNKKWVKYSLLIIALISVLIPVIGSFRLAIDTDSAIILTEMERIYEGYVPYNTMHLQYPPLWFYIDVFFKWLFHVPFGCYSFYLGIHWLYVIGCAVCLYCISCKISDNKAISLLVAWLFMIVSHWLQGNQVLFEIPSLLWGLLAIVLAFKWEKKHASLFIIVGVIASCSFLTKQFGAGFSLLVAWLIIASKEDQKWKQLGYYALGYALPVLVCYAYWGQDFFDCILFNGYGTAQIEAFWGDVVTPTDKLMRMIRHLFHFANRIAPVVYGGVILLPFAIKQGKYREILLCFFALGGFLLQYWFVYGGYHYDLYLVPFALLLIPVCLSLEINKYLRYGFYVLILLTTLFSLYSTYNNRVWKVYCNPNYHQKTEQLELGKRVSSIVEEGKTVFVLHGSLYLYYTANLYPPCMKKYGYAVGPMEISVDKCAEMVENSDYVIRFSKEMMHRLYPDGREHEYFFTDSIQQIVEQYPTDTLTPDGSILIHYMCR